MKLTTKWNQMKRVITLILAALFGVSVVAIVVGLLVIQPESEPPKPTTDVSQADPGTKEPVPLEEEPKPVDAGGEAPEGLRGSALAEEEMPKLEFDENGFAKMAVTTDPYVAAASAAQVLLSVQGDKVRYAEDFRAEALRRVTRPSPQYIGIGDQLTVDVGSHRVDGSQFLNLMIENSDKRPYSASGWWWRLGDERFFPQSAFESRAIAVYSQAEMTEYLGGPESWMNLPPQYQLQLTKPGAQFGYLWVRLEQRTIPGDGTPARAPAALSIYCDPPEEGGICGVVELLRGYPSSWKQ